MAAIPLSRKDAERIAEATGEDMERWDKAERDRLRFTEPPPPRRPRPSTTLYIEIDGTGVPMTQPEVAGRKGKQKDGSARTAKPNSVASSPGPPSTRTAAPSATPPQPVRHGVGRTRRQRHHRLEMRGRIRPHGGLLGPTRGLKPTNPTQALQSTINASPVSFRIPASFFFSVSTVAAYCGCSARSFISSGSLSRLKRRVLPIFG